MTDFHALKIADVQAITADALAVTFAVPEALRAAYRFRPGQHIVIRRTFEGREERRNYSICGGGGADGTLRIGIKRVTGGLVSTWAQTALKKGMMLDVLPPSGRFVLPEADDKGVPLSDDATRQLVMIAAGAGITPILAMVRHALEHETATEVTLIYGNRGIETTMFAGELEDLKDRFLERLQLIHILSRNDEVEAPLFQGRITAEKVRALGTHLVRFDTAEHVFLCGPGTMIKDVRAELLAMGIAREKVHHEFFAAGGGAYRNPAPAPVANTTPAEAADARTLFVVLDGARVRVPLAEGEHVIDAAIRAGLRVPYACKGGMCCTCRARIVEGSAAMTANYSLEQWEIDKGFVLTCQAVATSARLVVDFDAM